METTETTENTQETENNVKMIQGDMSPDSHAMISALLGVLRMRESAVGTSAMLALISAHFVRLGVGKEEFLNVCGESFSFYETQIKEHDAMEHGDKNDKEI